jgi:hypothetical protein
MVIPPTLYIYALGFTYDPKACLNTSFDGY